MTDTQIKKNSKTKYVATDNDRHKLGEKNVKLRIDSDDYSWSDQSRSNKVKFYTTMAAVLLFVNISLWMKRVQFKNTHSTEYCIVLYY